MQIVPELAHVVWREVVLAIYQILDDSMDWAIESQGSIPPAKRVVVGAILRIDGLTPFAHLEILLGREQDIAVGAGGKTLVAFLFQPTIYATLTAVRLEIIDPELSCFEQAGCPQSFLASQLTETGTMGV